MKRSTMWMYGLLSLTIALTCGSTGCGAREAPTGTVSGTVTMGGQPVTAGVVSFLNAQLGIGGSGELDESGNYWIPGRLPLGEYGVAVQPPPLPPPHEMAGSPPPSNIPPKYRESATSGLTATITEGDNTANFEL